jgi:hypothetical protein
VSSIDFSCRLIDMDLPLNTHRHLLPVFLLYLILQTLFFAPRLNSDGAYYYEFVRSLVIQNDLNFDDEREFFTWEWVPVFRNYLPGDWEETGYPPNIFSFGPALLWIPFFLVTHWFVLCVNALGASISVNGYDLIYRFLPMMTSILAGLATIYLIDWLMKKGGYLAADRSISLFFMLGASHWPAFLFVTPAFSHASSILAVSAFYLVWLMSRDAGWSWKGYALYGLLGGAVILTRWQNVFCLILPMCDAVVALVSSPTGRDFRQRLHHWTMFGVAVLVGITPQLIVTWILYGKPVTDPQGEGGMMWTAPRFGLILFEGIKGLYTVNPILLLATILLPLLFWKRPRLAWGMILIFIVQLYINAIRRDWAGVGFGMRRFLNLLPVFTLGLAAGLDAVRTRFRGIPRILILAFGSGAVIWNILLMAQYYYSELGAPWTGFAQDQMIKNQFDLSPLLLKKLIGTSLVFSGFSGNTVRLCFGLAGLIISVLFLRVTYGIFGSGRVKKTAYRTGRYLFFSLMVIFFVDVWLVTGAWQARSVAVIDLVPGKTFGQTRKLTLNPESGYQGFPGGLIMGPGRRVCVMDIKADYIRDQFLALGRLGLKLRKPCLKQSYWETSLKDPVDCRSVVVISRTALVDIADGMEIGTVSLFDSGIPVKSFSIRQGYETGSSHNVRSLRNVQILRRDFPAVNVMSSVGRHDYRAVFEWDDAVRIGKIRVTLINQSAEWSVHGLAVF